QSPGSPGTHTTAASGEEKLFVGNGIVLTVGISNPSIKPECHDGVPVDYLVASDIQAETQILVILKLVFSDERRVYEVPYRTATFHLCAYKYRIPVRLAVVVVIPGDTEYHTGDERWIEGIDQTEITHAVLLRKKIAK